MLTRRNLMLAGGGAVAAAALARPTDEGGSHGAYFSELNTTLRGNGIDTPVLVIDLDILDRNIDRLVKSIAAAPAKNYRVVAKSIPSVQLVEYVSRRASTSSLMVFHRPFLQAMAKATPKADILLGKPLPVSAAAVFYDTHAGSFDPQQQLQWLIDTKERLHQYLELGKARQIKLKVNLELDVGLHRGGFEAGESLAEAMAIIAGNSEYLEFSGFMGYDAHLSGIPEFIATGELSKVKLRYAACMEQVRAGYPEMMQPSLCFNGAGSPTFRHYEGDTVVNDLAAGSCLMKPTHFDLPILEDFEPSAFIASPVLKRLQGARLPALEWTGPVFRGWDPNQAQMYFCYSGNWLAENESPPGLAPHFAYVSSNQQGYSASSRVDLAVDDFIFLRPTQSEAVLLQFGDLLAVRGNEIVDRWPVLPVGF